MSLLSAFPAAEERRQFRASGRLAERAYALRAEIIQTREGLDAIARQWEALEAQVEGAVLFQGSGWARAIFDFEASRGRTGFQPVIATLNDGQRLVAVLPLERVRTRARTVLMPLGHAFSQ